MIAAYGYCRAVLTRRLAEAGFRRADRIPHALPRGVDVAADHADAGAELDDPPRGFQRPHGVAQVALQGEEDRQPAGLERSTFAVSRCSRRRAPFRVVVRSAIRLAA